MRFSISCLFLLLLWACAAPELEGQSFSVRGPGDWQFGAATPALRKLSCPDGTEHLPAQDIAITAAAIPLGQPEDASRMLPPRTEFVGGWHLTSTDRNFGGLSGLDILPSGDLLSVSDAGAFVWIDMQDAAPKGSGKIAYMRGMDGNFLPGKRAADAEGLAIRDGLALVSFEQDHRVLAFDLKGCGAAAHGALIARLPGSANGQTVKPNKGAEALHLTQAGKIRFGYETTQRDRSAIGQINGDGTAQIKEMRKAPQGFALVGFADGISLYRSYDPVRGNRNIVRISGHHAIRLKRPLNMDNFEGVAAQSLPDGRTRIYLISDDNFSARQRTLLYVFDVTPPTP